MTEFGAVPLHPSLIGPVESKANYVIECTGDAASAQQVQYYNIHKNVSNKLFFRRFNGWEKVRII